MKDQSHRAMQRMIGLMLVCIFCTGLWEGVLPQRTDAQQGSPYKSTGSGVPKGREGAGNRDRIVYTPPQRGVPGGREGAGSRGDLKSRPILTVLTPKGHMGLTIQEQPVLYWYL